MNLRPTLCATLAALLPLCTLALAPVPVHAQAAAGASQPPPTTTSAPRTARYCTNCATVETVRAVGAGGEAKAPAPSAAGGPEARRAQRYEVIVRYASNGRAQTLQYDNDPGFRAGDAVRVNNGVLSRDQ